MEGGTSADFVVCGLTVGSVVVIDAFLSSSTGFNVVLFGVLVVVGPRVVEVGFGVVVVVGSKVVEACFDVVVVVGPMVVEVGFGAVVVVGSRVILVVVIVDFTIVLFGFDAAMSGFELFLFFSDDADLIIDAAVVVKLSNDFIRLLICLVLPLEAIVLT